MPSSYTPLLRLTLPADGELVGTWGQTVNNGITSLEEAAIAGVANIALADANRVLTVANGAADEARNAVLQITGALTAQRDIIIPNNTKTYFVRNSTTGGFGVRIKTAAGAGIVVPANGATLVYCDGVNVGQAITAPGALTVTDIDGTPDLILKSSGTEKMRILANGNVGIGTPAPAFLLDVIRTQNSDAAIEIGNGSTGAAASASFRFGNAVASAGMTFVGSGSAAAAGPNSLNIYTNNAAPLAFGTSGVERMRIDAAGNVGIGATNPSSKLFVQGADVNISICGTTPTGIGGIAFLDDTIATQSQIWSGGSAYAQFGGARSLNIKAAGAMTLQTGGYNERMRIDAAGNVGIGNSSPDSKLCINNGNIHVRSGFIAISNFIGSPMGTLSAFNNDAVSGGLIFSTRIADVLNERMRIDAEGRVQIGTSVGGGGQKLNVWSDSAAVAIPLGLNDLRADTAISNIVAFFRGVSNLVGTISTTNTATQYNTTSDYRLKDAVEDLMNSGSLIDALRPRSWLWKNGGTSGAGFIAHEFAAVFPSSVSGEKDGKQMQSLDASTPEVMANIIAELKSLRLRVAALGG